MLAKRLRRTIMGQNNLKYLVVFVLISLFNKVFAAGNFELQILEISNTNSHLLSGYCCGVPLEIRNTKTTGCPPCSTAFRLCLKEYQSSIPSEQGILTGCSFGNASTEILGGSSFVLSDPEVGSIVLPFTFRWTKSFTLILQALDMYNTSYPVSEQLIEETSFSGVILPSPEWKTLDHIGKNSRITYRVRVQCAATYYNTTCTTFCRPRNDQFGHYTCSNEGNKICLPGWQGANCEKAICKPGCDPVHGKCDLPGECECRPGWRGPLCNECMVYPGCKHGSCNGSAWQCLCDTNWGGILCDQDLNYCGTHEPCMHGGTCENTAPDQYRCTCAEGLSGVRCEIVEHPCATQPCKNGGTCTLKELDLNESTGSTSVTSIIVRGMRGMSSMGRPVSSSRLSDIRGTVSNTLVSKSVTMPPLAEFTCTCAPGWTGPTCEVNIDECAGGPCEHGGTCIDLIGGFRCECPPEWTGDVCQMDVDECDSNPASNLGPCINAQTCDNMPGAFSCTCLEGWGGATCAKDLDDCIGQCKNGATCIDLVNDYHCACATGYTGRDCETDINECENSPCRNGGECVDLIGNFKCICPVGYSGTLCEEAKDHCTPSPCIQGSCLNTPGGYYCHCPTGRSGKHCELARAPCSTPPCNDGCSPPTNETIKSQLLTKSCSGHGKCEKIETGLRCNCHSGYTGLYCEHNLNECSPNPCKNGGICLDGDGDFTCECNSGWTGKICTERATQCYAGQCLNGGSCILINSVSQCRCTSGWNGQFCGEPIDQCQGQPCHNGGTCESGQGWFRCVCAQGFSGPDCRINVNECSPQPCLGGATCQDGIGGYTCICPPGRRGSRCEILLSDPGSVCLNTSTLSPYNPLGTDEKLNSKNNDSTEHENCNACVCENGRPKCTNLWCGLPNCLGNLKKTNLTGSCHSHQVCVPSLRESCLSPPCDPRGDCRALEPSKRVAPPNLPVDPECWPNQANLDENCARITILLELSKIPVGTSVEGICSVLRSLLASQLVKHSSSDAQLIIICDIKTGSNDTIEVTVSSSKKKGSQLSLAVKLMSELLSRHNTAASSIFQGELSQLGSVLEVKVETALISNETNNSGLFVGIFCGIGIVIFGFIILFTLFWRQRITFRSGSGVNLSPSVDVSRHDEEKSNNLQNEENLRRYANPLKGSSSSLRGAIELSMSPAPEITTVSTVLAGPSSLHRSQPLYPSCDTDFEKDLLENPKVTQKRNSQILLHKTQNSDVKKNTVGSQFDSPQKDFGKRSINCKSMPPVLDSDILTVHV